MSRVGESLQTDWWLLRARRLGGKQGVTAKGDEISFGGEISEEDEEVQTTRCKINKYRM